MSKENPPKISGEISELVSAPAAAGKPKAVEDDSTKEKTPKHQPPFELALVAEDSKANLAIISLNLRNLGYDVIEFQGGRALKEYIDNIDEAQRMRLRMIFSDYMMPEMSGLELLKFIRSHPKLGTLPFIICTAVNSRETVKQSIGLSVSAFILKPLTFEKLRKTLHDVFPKRHLPTAEEIATKRAMVK